ncbi:MAG: PQQ-binding-like beta-propeller repeat protein, partial [Bryobacteraceae bacterium]
LYSCSDRGVLKVYDARTGKLHYTQRLGEGTTGFSSSPVAVNGRLYFASEEGEVYVVKAGTAHELLAKNLLGEIAMASPAVSEGALYYRTRGHVVAIAEAGQSPR